MKIWLIEKGERTGPFESYKVRERISSGELKKDTLAWHEGAPDWVALIEMPAFASAFPKPVEPPQLPDHVVNQAATDEQTGDGEHAEKPAKMHLVQRFFARMIDVTLFLFLVSIFKMEQGLHPFEKDENIYAELNFLWLYVLVDALMIYVWGTTIGKKILNVSLTTATGGKLGLMESLLRSLRVWIVGLGMLIIPLLISLLITWLLSRKFGKLIWDLPKNYQVTVKPLTAIRIVIAILVVMAGSAVSFYFMPDHIKQELMEKYNAGAK